MGEAEAHLDEAFPRSHHSAGAIRSAHRNAEAKRVRVKTESGVLEAVSNLLVFGAMPGASSFSGGVEHVVEAGSLRWEGEDVGELRERR